MFELINKSAQKNDSKGSFFSYHIETMVDFEKFMGDSGNEDNIFSDKNIVILDEMEAFPNDACKELEKWGLHHYYVPRHYGGKLYSFETVFGLIRLVSRRDVTIAIAHCKTYLGAAPIWVAGSESQKKLLGESILKGKIVALGLTERLHGSDLTANELVAIKKDDSYILSGEKWLINNATRCHLMSIFAKTSENNSSRNHSLFIIDKQFLHQNSYNNLPKIKTHGIRGADISGIKFSKAVLNSDNLVFTEGSALEITLKSLQISRTMCASLSLGAADTALRTTINFVLNRNLYGTNIGNIPRIKEVIVDAFIDILISESLSMAAVRCMHFFPELMSLYSSVTKYMVPTTSESLFDSLADILGARFYLRECHEHGKFQKFLRDNCIVGLFDGSTIVNLQNISNQMNSIAKKSLMNINSSELSLALNQIFSLEINVPEFDASKLRLSNHGIDIFSCSLEYILNNLMIDSDAKYNNSVNHLLSIIEFIIKKRNLLFKNFTKRDLFHEKIDKSKENDLITYCKIISACCCLNFWYHNRDLENELISQIEWLKHCLIRIFPEIQDEIFIFSNHDITNQFKKIIKMYHEKKLFSLLSLNIC